MNSIEKVVTKIIQNVKLRGDSAVAGYIRQFDGVVVSPDKFKVTVKEMKSAYNKISRQSLNALKKVKNNVYKYHKYQISLLDTKKYFCRSGLEIKEKLIPLKIVGVYVPGGRYSYPSSVFMSVIPAKVAGVKEVVMVTPAKNLTPEVLVAADLCGVNKIFRIGGAQAVVALAFGTKTVPQVDKIVGPGNIYVTTAKKMLFGEVGIDLLAGPSEIIVLCDKTANQEFVLSDLLAQVEHDRLATASLVTTDKELLEWIKSNLPNNYCSQIELVNVPNIFKGIEIVNRKAPEHLSLIVKEPNRVIPEIRNAGTICVGNYTPVASSDYVAGPSHILPTGKTARFSSGVSVNDFLKRCAIIKYTKSGLKNDLRSAVTLAGVEGLKNHQNSLKIRVR